MIRISEDTKDQILRTLWVIIIGLIIVYLPYGAGKLADWLLGPFNEQFFFAHWVHGFVFICVVFVAIGVPTMICTRIYRYIRYGE